MSLEKAFCQLRQRHRWGFQWRPAKPTGRAGGREFILLTRMCSDRKLLSQQQSENYRHLQQIINTNKNYSSWAEGEGSKRKGCQNSTSITSGASASSISQTFLKYKVSCPSNHCRDAQTPVSSCRAELPRMYMLAGITDETATTAWVSLDVIKYSVNI